MADIQLAGADGMDRFQWVSRSMQSSPIQKNHLFRSPRDLADAVITGVGDIKVALRIDRYTGWLSNLYGICLALRPVHPCVHVRS
jgi:hypothetical protein